MLSNTWGEWGNSKGHLNAVTDITAGLYFCGENDSGHTFRYLFYFY